MAKNAFTNKQYAEAHQINDSLGVTVETPVTDVGQPFAFTATQPETTEPFDMTIEEIAAGLIDSADVIPDAVLEHQDPQLDLSASDELVLENAEAQDVVTEAPAEDVPAPQASDEPLPNFDAVTSAFSDEAAIAMALQIAAAVDERAAFEAVNGNDNIQKALAKSRKQLATPRAARVMMACQVDPAIINRSVHEGKRYNVYALGKLADAIYGLSGGAVNNAINIACMKSLFQFQAAGKEFTGEMAKAAASDKIRVDVGLRGLLVRHTVSASTSSTQASSTMQALTTLGIVARSGSHKNPTFTLTDSSVVEKLRAVVMPTAIAA